MPFSGPQKQPYSRPNPYVVPGQDFITNGQNQLVSVPTRFLAYAPKIIEEIMVRLSTEFSFRELPLPSWKKYLGDGSFETFNPNDNGSNIRGARIQDFPLYVRDIQQEIERLIADTRVPDTLAAYFVRIFANQQSIPLQEIWTSLNGLRDGVVVNLPEPTTINMLSRAQTGNWPVPYQELDNTRSVIGVTPGGVKQHNLTVESPDFPRSPLGLDIGSGIPGLDTTMTAANRPDLGSRTETNNIGTVVQDTDQGYVYLSHLAKSIHQLRWQPPIVEWFPNDQEEQYFAPSFISNTIPGRAFMLTQPITQNTENLQQWGAWQVKGTFDITDTKATIKADATLPPVTEGSVTQCPLPLFFPPPEVICSCGHIETAHMVWHSSDYLAFQFDGLSLTQSELRSTSQFFNKNTKLRIKIDAGNAPLVTSPTGGAGNEGLISVQTLQLGIVAQPFTNLDFGSVATGILEVNLMDAIEAQVPFYNKSGIDQLIAMKFEVRSKSSESALCQVSGGNTVDQQCRDGVNCANATAFMTIDSIELIEDSILQDGISEYL